MAGKALFFKSLKRRIKYQLLFLVFANAYFLSFLKVIPCPILNCYSCPLATFACPIGTIQHFLAIGAFPFVVVGVLGLVGAFVGRMTCGWLCPFGFLQDLMAKLSRKKYPIPHFLTHSRFVILVVLVVCLPFVLHEHWFCKLCPAGVLEAGLPVVVVNPDIRSQIGFLFVVKIVILVGFLVWMVFSKRPFCRVACPLGAILSLFNRVSFYRIRVTERKAMFEACRKLCPVDLNIYEDPDSIHCVRALDCLKCPGLSWGKRT
ncbi:MAG: 4Fe-4S binding protein [Actinomycetota bacterium]|nr:4Fe-4S binding protein [Actinomycetota bacterium]